MDKEIVIKTKDLNHLEERGKFQMTREEFDKVMKELNEKKENKEYTRLV